MKAVFISDVHLHKAQEERHRKLIEFLDDIREGKIQSLIQPDRPSTDKIFIDDLYIVGDLFDFWFCQENEIYPDFVPVITKLLELKKPGSAFIFAKEIMIFSHRILPRCFGDERFRGRNPY